MNTDIGFVGLGRMGLPMTTLLVEKGFRVVGYDANTVTVDNSSNTTGITPAHTLAQLVAALAGPRVIWLMVPSTFVDAVLTELVPLLAPGDTVIDGGNSFYQDSLRRHAELKARDINFLDVGTSGGVGGARTGAALMIGGDITVYATHEHIFAALATPDSYARVGNAGAGHFVKMVHNGIEYGMMGAIAEGMNVLHEHSGVFGLDLEAVFRPYGHESIIESKLISWLEQAYATGQIDAITGEVPRGETESEMEHITTIGVVPILSAALLQRQATRTTPSYVGKLIAAMRNQFGGHATIKNK